MRAYLGGKPAGKPIWPGTWAADRKAAHMLRRDLAECDPPIPYAIDSPDGKLFADFHSLRHTYLTLGGQAGIDLRTLQELAGQRTPHPPARYSHRRIVDLASAVEKLPSFLPPEGEPARPQPGLSGAEATALRATGTDGPALQADCKQTGGAPQVLTL